MLKILAIIALILVIVYLLIVIGSGLLGLVIIKKVADEMEEDK